MVKGLDFQESLRSGTVISVNYDEPDAVAKAIEAAAFNTHYIYVDDRRYVADPVKEIPLAGTGTADHEVFELHMGQLFDSNELDRSEFAFADPLTALRYAAKLPDRQLKHPLGVRFETTQGLECSLSLTANSNWRNPDVVGERGLCVSVNGPDSSWVAYIHGLVVRKPDK